MIKVYPIEIEAVDENDEGVFKLKTFDENSAILQVNAALTSGNIDDFCLSLKRALMMLELEDADESETTD